MTSTGPEVRRARRAEHAPAAEVLAQAFGGDPVMSWMIGADRDTVERLRHFFRHLLSMELEHSDHLVDVAGDGQAVALWHEVDQWQASPGRLLKMVPAAIRTFGRRLPVALRTSTMIEKVHPEEPHRHLAYIGVHPSSQGRGMGGSLLAAMTEECDAQGLGAYLESSNRLNDALYHRYGFESRGRITLPNGAPELIAMWRAPR